MGKQSNPDRARGNGERMNNSNRPLIQSHRRPARHRRGAMLVLIAIMMIGFMVAVAFSVDIAQMHLSRTELRTATDAASKAAASSEGSR